MCTLKIVTIMMKSCLLRGSRSSVGPGGAGGALRRRRRLLVPGELFLRLRGSTMFRLPDSPAPQLPPENRNKLVRNDVYAKK